MKVTTVRYEKLINLGNYENQKLGVEVALEDSETPAEAVQRAVAFVEASLAPKPDEHDIRRAKKIVEDPDNYSPKDVRAAQELLDKAEGKSTITF